MDRSHSRNARLWRVALSFCGAALIGLLLSAFAAAEPRAIAPPSLAGVPPVPGPLAAAAKPAPQGLVLLKTKPEWGKVGRKFTVSGEALPPNRDAEIVWGTWKGSYVMNPTAETVEFFRRQLDPIGVVLGRGKTNESGRLEVDLKVPEDYGEVHDIYAVIDGVQVAKGGFRVIRNVAISPRSGPVGTPVTIKVTGLGSKPFESTASVLYDNKYAGFISATTTRGTATVQIRAAGPLGTRRIEVGPASAAVNYLNIEQSPVYYVGKFRFAFRVTRDAGPPEATVEWPGNIQASDSARTTVTSTTADGVSAKLSSERGPILSRVDLVSAGLGPGAPAQLDWVTAVGARARPSGWSLETRSLGEATVGADGSLNAAFTVPDDLGGWHAVRVLQGGTVKAEIPYYVERSLVGIKPTRVKAGHAFKIHVKGVGWTELDNGFAVTYDNGYIGYACGFNSQGDVTMNMVATGGPGTHLIDIYPMIYEGKGNDDRWLTQVPMLSFKHDAPGLGLGYRLPAIRLAVEVVA